MKSFFLTYAFLLLVATSGALGQVTSTSIDTVRIDSSILRQVSMTDGSPSDTLASDEAPKPLIKVTPWEFKAPLGADTTATDSTLRWQIWPDWTYKLNRQPGVISYRMGTSIRSNAVQRNAHEPRHQQLYWEGILLNDPVSGMLNWSLIPQHKISAVYGEDLGSQYRTTYYLHQYYLNEPLSRLIYSESKFSSRNLEFEVSHNLSQQTNIELSYWDRREGGEYNNSEVIGRQIFAKASHHLDDRHYLKINYVNNKLDLGRPFGYNTGDMRTFNFDEYNTTANESSANSTEINNMFALNLYRRPADSTLQQKADNLHASLYYRSTQRSLQFSADSTAYNIGSVGLTARKWWTRGMINMEGGINYEYFFNKEQPDIVLDTNNWGRLEAEGRVLLKPAPFLALKGGSILRSRSDGFHTYQMDAEANISVGKLSLSPGLSTGTVMPTPQQLYWQSNIFTGNPDLLNEEMQETRIRIAYAFTSDTQLGIHLQHKDINNGIMIEGMDLFSNTEEFIPENSVITGTDSTFANKDSYASQAATAFFNWDASHFEINGSATMHRFTNSTVAAGDPIPMSAKKRVWLKGGAYWKGYLFDRATYVKAGLSGMIAPFRYQADHYSPELDYWQSVSDDQALPVFNRLDFDLSARVRSIVFVMRWQNILDDVNQLGYFETAGYPMSQRRFLFGVRAVFRN